MKTVKIVIVDFCSRGYSDFIASVNRFHPNIISRTQQHFDGSMALFLFEQSVTLRLMRVSMPIEGLSSDILVSADVFVLVIPCNQPSVFAEAEELIQPYAKMPFVIVTCNNETLSDDQIRHALNLPDSCPVMPYLDEQNAIDNILRIIIKSHQSGFV